MRLACKQAPTLHGPTRKLPINVAKQATRCCTCVLRNITDAAQARALHPLRARPSKRAVTRALHSAAAVSASAHLPALLTSVAWLLLSVAVSLFLLACIPFVAAATHSAVRMAAILRIVEKELPDTIATARLSGLELTDCVREMSELGSDLSGGVQATARMISATESNLQQGAALLTQSLTTAIKPAVAQKEQQARGRST
jgi:hypothetical protein